MPAKHKSIVLFTPYFAARTAERQRELDLCLERNVACDVIERIILLVDDGWKPPIEHTKIEIVLLDNRPTYRQWISLSHQMAPDALSVLANTDIYFDETLGAIRRVLARPKAFMALSRHDKLGDRLVPHPNPHWSQDVWAIDASQMLEPGLHDALNVPLGVPRCDNKVAFVFAIHGWSLFNPQGLVRSVHVHESQQRNYDKKTDLTVIGPVAYVQVTNSLTTPSKIDIDVYAMNCGAIRSVKLNRSLDALAADEASAVEAASPSVDKGLTRKGGARLPLAPAEVAPRERNDARWPAASSAEKHRFVTEGERVFQHLGRFAAYRLGDDVLTIDWMNPASTRRSPLGVDRNAPSEESAEMLLALFIPPVFDTNPVIVRERPTGPEDCQFWQYPCFTEKQAYDNHLGIGLGANVDRATRTVNTYLGLPWATYIDKKAFPDVVLARLAPRIRGLAFLAERFGYRLAVHTVCQQIHWRRLVDQFHALNVTDLHLSHAEKGLDTQREGWTLRLHSWPLIAPNVEEPSRRDGLVIGKPLEQKRYFASFIGAHMPHYRSGVRLQLLELAKSSGREDIIVDLGNEWHFNNVVYKEQVQHVQLSASDLDSQSLATRRYNEMLSDSIFSLCPEGAGPNTLRVWESLAVGAIPVILADQWAVPVPMGDAQDDLHNCCVFIEASEIATLFDRLRAIPPSQLRRMQASCIRLYARIRARTAFPAIAHPAT